MRSRHQAPDFQAKRLRLANALTRDFASLRLRSAACLSLVLACPAAAHADSLAPWILGPFFFPSGMYPDRFASQGRPPWVEQSLTDPLSDPGYKFGLRTTDTYTVREANSNSPDFPFPGRNWEANWVQDLRMNFGMLDDRLQLTMKQSHSFYAADRNYLLQLASKNRNSSNPGRERFLAANSSEGDADLQRIDAKLYRSDFLEFTTFASHRDVDAYYESFASTKAKDEFSVSNRSSQEGGAKLRLGSLSLTSAYANAEYVVGAGTPTQVRQEQMIAFDFTDFRRRTGDSLPAAVWSVAPSSVFVSAFTKSNQFKTAAEGPPDQTTGISAGAAWAWDGGDYANVGYWGYGVDSRRAGAASYDSAGRGLDVTFGTFWRSLGFDGGLSYRRFDDLAPYSRSIESSYDAYLSASYKLYRLPDLSLTGALGRYDYQSPVGDSAMQDAYWSATVALDFSKYLVASSGSGGIARQPDSERAGSNRNIKGPYAGTPTLKLLYRYLNDANQGFVDVKAGSSHLFGLLFAGRL